MMGVRGVECAVMGREAALIDLCLRLLRLHGVFCWRNNVGAMRIQNVAGRPRFVRFGGIVGAADILGCAPGGRFLAIEVKTGRVSVTEHQARFLEEVRAHGGLAAVIRSSDEVLALLARKG